MFEFQCPECYKSIRADSDQAGSEIFCPKCQSITTVPANLPQSQSLEPDLLDEQDDLLGGTSVAEVTGKAYSTPEDDLEPLVDNDEEAVRKEVEEQNLEMIKALTRNRGVHGSPGEGSSSLTSREKSQQRKLLQDLIEALPEDSPLLNPDKPVPATEPETIQLEGRPENPLSARCEVCGSLTLANNNLGGQTIQCPDCGSDVVVATEEEEAAGSRAPEWSKWAQSEKVEDSEPLNKNVDELLNEVPEIDSEEYGLEPVVETPQISLPYTIEDFTQVPIESEVELDELEVLDESAPPVPKYLPPSVPSNVRRPPKKDMSEVETSALMEEMRAEKETVFLAHPWGIHIFGLFTEVTFIARLIPPIFLLITSIGLFNVTSYCYTSGNPFLALFSILLGLPMIVLSVFALVGLWSLGQMTIDATAVGRTDFSETDGFSLWEWISSAMFVGVSFALCGLPGLLLGLAIFQLSGETENEIYWFIPSLFSGSAMLLTPLLLIGAIFNESPFIFASKKVNKSFQQHRDAWVEFYIAAPFVAFATSAAWLIGMTTAWIFIPVMSVTITILFAIYYRMCGRLLGRITSGSEAS